jgi:alpha-galactosidase
MECHRRQDARYRNTMIGAKGDPMVRVFVSLMGLLISLCSYAVEPKPGDASAVYKYSGVAQTPPMGWNSWNTFGCEIDEALIRQVADVMVTSGMRGAGYVYVNIDDCWHGKRDEDGLIQPDPKRFPSGMKALADYVHGKGLKLGLYSDAGSKTCAGFPGSQGHEHQDALRYARW